MFRRKDIPVGDDGYVPFDAIVQRFHQVGDMRDSESTESIVLPNRLTPEQIAEWWENPSVCDIDGVDTEDSDIYSVPLSIRGRKRKALRRIAVLADKKESDRIKKVLADSFTAEELEEMAGGESLMVSTKPHLRDCTGFYLRKQESVPVPRIVLEEGTTDDGIVHEAVHHLRVKEGRSSFPTLNGILHPSYRGLPNPTPRLSQGRRRRPWRKRLRGQGWILWSPDTTSASPGYRRDRHISTTSRSSAVRGR